MTMPTTPDPGHDPQDAHDLREVLPEVAPTNKITGIYVCEPCDDNGDITAGVHYDTYADQVVCQEHAGDEETAYFCEFIGIIPAAGDDRMFGKPTADMPRSVYDQVASRLPIVAVDDTTDGW